VGLASLGHRDINRPLVPALSNSPAPQKLSPPLFALLEKSTFIFTMTQRLLHPDDNESMPFTLPLLWEAERAPFQFELLWEDARVALF
jgi:hypothetical protein